MKTKLGCDEEKKNKHNHKDMRENEKILIIDELSSKKTRTAIGRLAVAYTMIKKEKKEKEKKRIIQK
jgi:ligand-binding SRPBCC domain-containing protein